MTEENQPPKPRPELKSGNLVGWNGMPLKVQFGRAIFPKEGKTDTQRDLEVFYGVIRRDLDQMEGRVFENLNTLNERLIRLEDHLSFLETYSPKMAKLVAICQTAKKVWSVIWKVMVAASVIFGVVFGIKALSG
jgi:hypothetical protein